MVTLDPILLTTRSLEKPHKGYRRMPFLKAKSRRLSAAEVEATLEMMTCRHGWTAYEDNKSEMIPKRSSQDIVIQLRGGKSVLCNETESMLRTTARWEVLVIMTRDEEKRAIDATWRCSAKAILSFIAPCSDIEFA